MISQWKVVQHVARRYGKLEDIFDQAEENLRLVREGKLPVSDLETNPDRIRKRLAREAQPSRVRLERIIGPENLQDKNIIDKLSLMASAVCRLVKDGSPVGTGFLVSEGVVMTNHHVIEHAEDADGMVAEFNYELDLNNTPKRSACFKLESNRFFLTSTVEKDPNLPDSGLDFTMVAVSTQGTFGESLDPYPPIFLDGNLGKIIRGESCVIIQHPKGLVKKIVLKDTAFFSETGSRIVYESDTLPGSSGSMVVALGTGEVVALHHSALPRTDNQNRPLTKSGQLANEATADDEIDWYANEGIKISCIIQAVKNAMLPLEMEPFRRNLLTKTNTMEQRIATAVPDVSLNGGTVPPPIESRDRSSSPKVTGERIQYFEIMLNENEIFCNDWRARASQLVPNLVSRELLLPEGTTWASDLMEYLAIRSDADPWKLAEAIENLPHVELCTPDLESLTDIGAASTAPAGKRLESVVYNDGTAEWNEPEFIKDWSSSHWYKTAQAVNIPNYHRQWNWVAVKCPEDKRRTGKMWDQIQANVANIRYTQLDTGYTRHSKVLSGFDLTRDFDFVDQDMDAEDKVKELNSRLLLKFPSHGTRTASLAVGGRLANDVVGLDGNSGLLTFAGANPVPLIPYRIAKSVVLIGRGKEMVNAAHFAIEAGTDVMFICMGSYPRPMFEMVAREAYERGVIWVCAAGNEVELVVAPAMYPGTIAVSGMNPDDLPWRGSSNGKMVDIAAPGEAVYVPFVNNKGEEIMAYGAGTSYATPHVASAAVLWKAKNFQDLKSMYTEPWMVVEAFRECLKTSARRPANWPEHYFNAYGAGVLDIEKLLSTRLPPANKLNHAYRNIPPVDKKDLGLREAAHHIWNTFRRKLKGGPLESVDAPAMSARAKAAVAAYAASSVRATTLESNEPVAVVDAHDLLRNFFNQ